MKPTNGVKIDAYKKELAKIQKQKDRLLDLYLSEGITKPVFTDKTHDFEQREEFLKQELKRLAPPISGDITAEKVKKMLSDFLNSANADSPEYKKRLLGHVRGADHFIE